MKYFSLLSFTLFLFACSDDTTGYFDLGNPFSDGGNCGTCSIGCCQNNKCMIGNTNAACGTGGGPCDVCDTATEQCVNNICSPLTPTCNATTCPTGCCTSAGSCINPPTDSACGMNGSTCKACESDELCNALGKCELNDPLYSFYIKSAQLDHGDCGYISGFTDNCDPYYTLAIKGETPVESNHGEDTDVPTWSGPSLTAPQSAILEKGLQIKIMDDDSPLNPDTIGNCDLPITQKDLDQGELITDCGNAKDVTIVFKKQ